MTLSCLPFHHEQGREQGRLELQVALNFQLVNVRSRATEFRVRLRRSILSLFATMLCYCTSEHRDLITKKPAQWAIEVSTKSGYHERLVAQIHNYGSGLTQLVVKEGDTDKPWRDYKLLCVSELSEEEASPLYHAAVATLRDFRFTTDAIPGVLDGGYAEIELRVGTRSMSAGFSYLTNDTELPSSMLTIMKFVGSKLANQMPPADRKPPLAQ